MIRRFSQWFIFSAAIISVLATLLYVQHAIEALANRPVHQKEIVAQHPDVSIVTVASGSYPSKIIAYGSVSPHFELSLTAQVSGQVETLSAAFESGRRVKKGDLLVCLDETDYQAAVVTAEQTLSDARLSLIEEQRQALQSETEWKSSGIKGEPASDLVLHKPQLTAAQAAVDSAEAVLESARNNLAHTRITTPFDALVVERLVAPGSFVQAGTVLATLYSTDRVEVAVSLSAAQWSGLPDTSRLNNGTWPVELRNAQTGDHWSGYVLRSEQHLDGKSRQRRLILAVDHPLDAQQPLLAGTFIQAEISGRSLDNLWRLPASAFSQKGEIWYVTAGNALSSFTAEPSFSDADAVYILPPAELADGAQKVLVHPLNSYLKGMIVNPVEEKSHE